MTVPLEINNTRSLVNLRQYDVVDFGTEQVTQGTYMVFSIEIDYSIKAALLQLWKFDGGYDHAVINVMEVDFGLNTQILLHNPKIKEVTVESITAYRPVKSTLSDKETFFFDVWPDSTSDKKTASHILPYTARIDLNGEKMDVILPTWTPLQRLPIDRISNGTILELWSINNINTVMKVVKL